MRSSTEKPKAVRMWTGGLGFWNGWWLVISAVAEPAWIRVVRGC
ncbi:MAG: hypothetical protein QXN18_06820 [Nitrososphaerota archaeon]